MNELPGRDIICDDDGLWRNVETANGLLIQAAPIIHRSRFPLHKRTLGI